MRLKEAGADAVKILVYYNPFEKDWVNERKKAWLERIGAECKSVDIAYFLEFLPYSVHGEDEGSAEHAKRKPEIIIRSMEEFAQPRYGADVLKIDVPITMAYVEGTSSCKGEAVYSRDEAKRLIREAASKSKQPLVYLSAGVSSSVFLETLELIHEAGVDFHGVLAGRATWQNGVSAFIKEGAAALEKWMNTQGVQNVRDINNVLRLAKPWWEAPSIQA